MEDWVRLSQKNGTPAIGKNLQFIADGLTKAAPGSRILLGDALVQLEEKE
jgi:hypothetical protein